MGNVVLSRSLWLQVETGSSPGWSGRCSLLKGEIHDVAMLEASVVAFVLNP